MRQMLKCMQKITLCGRRKSLFVQDGQKPKDFKVQAMDGWRRDNKYAVVVAPLYQLLQCKQPNIPTGNKQDVCLLSYSHVAILETVAMRLGLELAQQMLTKCACCHSKFEPQ